MLRCGAPRLQQGLIRYLNGGGGDLRRLSWLLDCRTWRTGHLAYAAEQRLLEAALGPAGPLQASPPHLSQSNPNLLLSTLMLLTFKSFPFLLSLASSNKRLSVSPSPSSSPAPVSPSLEPRYLARPSIYMSTATLLLDIPGALFS